jgi:NADH-quinone oxidoreductase subunit G
MQPQDLVTLTIDGREVSVPKGTTVLHAAEALGIEIPTFCYNNKMDPLGACRMCLVSIERAKGFPPACATPVAPGMVVRTVVPDVVKTQQGMLEFLLINHPLDCPICDKGGECPLQNLTFKYGPGKSRYSEEKRHFQKHLPIGPQIVLDRERCIVCQLCVRYMEDVADDPQITLMSRGGKTEVNVFPDRPFDSPFAGNTIELCPVGALTSRKYRFRARPWDLQHTDSICPTCSVGCNVRLDIRRNELLRLYSRENPAVDDGWLCDYGRFGTLDRMHEGERIISPMVRRDGVLEPASWEEALDAAAHGLRQASHTGAAAVAGPRVSNEELYLLGRLTRTLLRSTDVAVQGASLAPTGVLGGAPIAALEESDLILLIDADPIARQHVLDLRIKKQVKRRGVPLVILANGKTGLDYLASAKLPFDAADPAATVRRLLDLLAVPPADGAAAPGGEASVPPRVAGGIMETVKGLIGGRGGQAQAAPEPPQPVVDEPLQPAVDLLRAATRGVVVYDERLLSEGNLDDLSAALGALADRLAGAEGAESRPLALAAGANTRGAAEMGAHGRWLAGGAGHSDATAAADLGKAWGLQPALGQGGSAEGILEAARQGTVRGLYLYDCDPIRDGMTGAVEALQAAPFVVLQASRTSAAMEHADVVLPTTNFAETSGTLTNTEGRVQRLRAGLRPPEDVREGWQTLCDLAAALGGNFRYLTGEDVTQEIARVTGLPSWAGLLQRALEPVAGGTR